MKLKNKLLLATGISLGLYVFFVYIAINTFLYPELLKIEVSNLYEKEERSESLINNELQNLQDAAIIFAILYERKTISQLDSEIIPHGIDFVYLYNIDPDKDFLIQKYNKNHNNENYLENFLYNYILKLDKSDKRSFTDILKIKDGGLLIAAAQNSDNNIVITGQFLTKSVLNKNNYDIEWNANVLFDQKLIKMMSNSKFSQKSGDHLRNLVIDNSKLKSLYLIKVGSFDKQVILEINVKQILLYNANIVLIFTFLGPLAILFLILIVRIIQSHDV